MQQCSWKVIRNIHQKICNISFCQRKNYSALSLPKYDLVVIGGGSGGLACAKEAADLGAKVAVFDYVEETPLGTQWDIGGTCVNVGCIPKKLMHQSALLGHNIKDSFKFGWNVPDNINHDWSTLNQNVQMYIRSLNWGHKVQLNQRKVKYYNAKARLKDKNTILGVTKKGTEVIVNAQHIVIAVGGRPTYPDIPGAKEHCLTSDDVFWKSNPPGKTLVVGSSYVGLECAGFINGLGMETTLLMRSIPLRGFDQQIAELITDHMMEGGIEIIRKKIPVSVERVSEHEVEVTLEDLTLTRQLKQRFNTVLWAIGRHPVTQSLNLHHVGVNTNDVGKIITNDFEQSSIDNIYAIGDAAVNRMELTPVAIQSGKMLSLRLFGNEKEAMNYNYIPTTVFTPLEYGCVGLTEEEAIGIYKEDNIEVFHAFYKPLEYSLPDRNTAQCYIKLICERSDSQRILGFHLLGPNAGEVTQGFAVAIKHGLTYPQLKTSVGIHPTCAEEIVKLHITKRSGDDPTVTGC